MSDEGRSYEDEQEALQKELEGGGASISAPIPFPEVNQEVYRDVEPILFRGFLTQAAEINGVPFVFKSINHHEYNLINLVVGGEVQSKHKVKDYYDLFLTYGVLMVDGQNILVNRETSLPDLKEFFRGLHSSARQKVIRHLSEINRRSYKAVILTEAYAMESVSRLRWAQLHGSDLTSTAVTGIYGTSMIGLNWGQLTWRALNYYEDLKLQSESDWENAKFVASSMAGKGMSKIHSHDRDRREKERAELISRRDKILRHVLLGEPMEGKSVGDNVVKQVASTVPELTEQLERDLKGEKDWHDQVVEAHERRVREGYESKAAQIREVAKRHQIEADGRQVFGGTALGGLSPQEVQEQILRKRQLSAQKAASNIVYPELYDERHEEFMAKWNLPRATMTSTDKDPSAAVPLPTARPAGTPWRGK